MSKVGLIRKSSNHHHDTAEMGSGRGCFRGVPRLFIYQKEWEPFGVPGGISFFLFFNFFAFLPLLQEGIETTVEGSHHLYWLYVIPLTGLLTCILHAAFMAFGRSEFTQPLSLLILGTLFVSSSLQLLLARHL